MPPYTHLYRPAFLECLRKYPDKKKRVEKFVNRICDNPYFRSELLEKKKGIDLHGKRSRHLTGNFVLVYVICEECITNGHKGKYNDCTDCPNEAIKRIIFLAFAKHDDIYARRWRTD